MSQVFRGELGDGLVGVVGDLGQHVLEVMCSAVGVAFLEKEWLLLSKKNEAFDYAPQDVRTNHERYIEYYLAHGVAGDHSCAGLAGGRGNVRSRGRENSQGAGVSSYDTRRATTEQEVLPREALKAAGDGDHRASGLPGLKELHDPVGQPSAAPVVVDERPSRDTPARGACGSERMAPLNSCRRPMPMN